MKKWIAACLLMLALPVLALADGPVLLVELPEDAQMVENIEFEDGDFIQTYHLADGTQVQLLRYASFDMTVEELAQSEWTGYTSSEMLDIAQVGGCPAAAMSLVYEEEGQQPLEVTLVLVDAGAYKLMLSAVSPQGAGVADMVETMDILDTGAAQETDVNEEIEVG